jgi:hypothetical protein
MTLQSWLDAAHNDAERRGLSALRPLLEGLGRQTAALRAADWNLDLTPGVSYAADSGCALSPRP